MASVAAISQQIWDMKYRLKSAAGAPVDKSIDDSWRRVADTLARPEKERQYWAERFYEALQGFEFLPAGRIIAGAGAARNVTLFNCFVMGTIPDDMSGIFQHLKEAALTMQQGGGIGYDFSTLRPKGAPVKGVGADASGPLSFMDVWDSMCRTIMSAGARRGAMMATMRCDHPDIEAFVEAKHEPGRLRMFNLSVLVGDAFMEAVRDNQPWDLVFDGVCWKTLPARELWEKIMRATYAYAEPGVIFIDRINRLNNLNYCEEIHSCNPCVTRDAWVPTAMGPRQVGELLGRPFTALVDGHKWPSGKAGFFATGRKTVVRLKTREGYSLRLTPDHPIRRVAVKTRWRKESEWTRAGDLRPGDEVILNDHREAGNWSGPLTEDEGYLIGLLIGDGTLKSDKAVLSVWPGAMAVNGDVPRPGVMGIMARAEEAARTLPSRSDFTGWIPVPGRGEHRLAIAALKHLAKALGMAPGNKAITAAMERASSAFYRGFLRGLFDADGSVQGTQAKGVSIRLSQSNRATLEAVQRMLLRLGIYSRIYGDRRPAGPRLLPDGKGGRKSYDCAADHELIISNENLLRFDRLVGFSDTDKVTRLKVLLANYARRPNRERFSARVETVIEDGVEEVFDVEIPGLNAFDANGFYVHNCGEQPLPPYGACLLGSINLARLVRNPFEDGAVLDIERLRELVPVAVRMMDNAIDVSGFPLPEQAHEARAKRRMGLGITGLGDALIMCRARYGSDRALELTEGWMKEIRRAAYLASSALAAEKGAFPLYDAGKFLQGESVKTLDADVREAIARDGIRNALLTSVAPTGTISLFADNVSSGLEPVYAFTYTRHIRLADGESKEEEVSDYAYRLFRRLKGEDAPLPDYFVDTRTLDPIDHIVMQALVQKYVDSSISKTINVPSGIVFDDFKDVYDRAYDAGCKGCTTYRPNEVTGAVLEVKDGDETAEPELPLDKPPARAETAYESGGVVYMTQPLHRPEELPGKTYKIKWPESDHAMYITVNDVVRDGRRRPFEIFINSKNMENYAWMVALTRMISAVFRRGGDVSFVVEELKAVFDPRGGQWMGGRYVPSLLAAIGDVIENHMIDIGFLASPKEKREGRLDTEGPAMKQVVGLPDARFRQCPKCGQASVIRQENCDVCVSCAYSKCS
ncbi:MAG: ribonucleoside reductase [Proteobacteria bacterium]|nr:ribonucleoside reductase [Pseudomonadota bacterium]